jgi:hypothetical protein
VFYVEVRWPRASEQFAHWVVLDANASPVAAGVYFYDLTVDARNVGQKKTVIVR